MIITQFLYLLEGNNIFNFVLITYKRYNAMKNSHFEAATVIKIFINVKDKLLSLIVVRDLIFKIMLQQTI